MDKKELIKNMFSNPFNKERYSEFLTELFNESIYEEENISYLIDKGFEQYIEEVYDYGTFIDYEAEELKLYIVKLKNTHSLERARTMQRNFISKLLSGEWIDNALVAFYDNNKDWRFSFIKIEPAFDNEKFIEEFNKKFDEQYNTLIDIIKSINKDIIKDKSLGSGFEIGHSYFLPKLKDSVGNKKDLEDIIRFEIVPLLEEYWYDDEETLIKWKENLYGYFR